MGTTTTSPEAIQRRRLHALLELARASWATQREGRADLGPLLEAAAEVLEADRVAFWRLDAERRSLHCEHRFLARERQHLRDASTESPAAVSAGQLATMGEARVIQAPDGVTLLEAPVRVGGEIVGVVRHEREGDPPRAWGPEDRFLAASLADLVALALESWGRSRSDERLAHVALHDPLTDLPNQRLFRERIERSLRGLERRSGLVAVLSLEVGGLPALGPAGEREARDQMIAAAAKALVGVLRPADTPARLEEDGFGVLIDRLDEPWEAIAVAERVLQAFHRKDATLAGRGAAIGVAMADASHPTSAEALLHDAGVARVRARERGGARYEVFEATLRRDILERMSLGWDLRDALSAGQLVVEYQPELALPSRRLLGVEALLRWNRPGHGPLLAPAFLDLAESSGLIVSIGAWVLGEACRQTTEWRKDPRAASLGLRVNLSARQFEEPTLVDTVATALAQAGLPASALCLEITETVLMSNAAASLGTLTALKALGVGLAVDDFGIGYSSLAYLKRFPVDTLKIDRSFVEGLGTDPIDLPIVQAILSLGKTLGLQVVAEGVERPLQEQTLRALGCERAQGFLYARSVLAAEVPSFFGPA